MVQLKLNGLGDVQFRYSFKNELLNSTMCSEEFSLPKEKSGLCPWLLLDNL